MAYTTIKKPSDYFNTVLYEGNATDNHIITGVNFQPDLVWIKDRDRTGYNHRLQDNIRGSTKSLLSNLTSAEQTNADAVKSFNSDGFVLGVDTANGSFNGLSSFVSWNWLASNTTASNTDGSITSTVSANTTSGFSIVSYTGNGTGGATVGHGLGAIPKMVIIKCRTSTPSWQVWGDGYTRLSLNNTDGDLGSNGMTRGASTVTLPSGINDWNGSGQDYIMYCWSEVKGFSKFGQYTGNFNADGTFVYTGFKPAFIIIKSSSISSDWGIWDNKRPEYNVVNLTLQPHKSNAEVVSVGRDIDILSNGFKARGTSSSMNGDGATYIYMAIAEQPLVGDNPCTAR